MRNLIAAIFISLISYFCLLSFTSQGSSLIIVILLAFASVLIIIVLTQYFALKKHAQISIEKLTSLDRIRIFSEQLLLPSLFFFVNLGMLFYFRFHHTLFYFLIVATTFCYWQLLTNIQAYYEHKLKIEHESHYIYDLLLIALFFMLTLTWLETTQYFGINYYLANTILWLFLSSILTYAYFRYYVENLRQKLKLMLISEALFLVFFLVFASQAILTRAYLHTVYAILVISYYHHQHDASFSVKVFLEYCVIILLGYLILIFY